MLDELPTSVQVESRPYQRRITRKAVEMLTGQFINHRHEPEDEVHSVMIESPTGSGKTVMGLSIARWMQENRGYRIGWVAMRRNLLSQAQLENSRRQFGVDLQLISMFEKNPPKVDMLIVDEAQHDAATSMANLHCTIEPKKILGLSATPFRTDRVRLCFDKVIADAGIHALIQDGYLSNYHHYTIPQYNPESVAQFYLQDQSRWGKTLVFFHTLDQCQRCLNHLQHAGVKVDLVTAKTNRESQLEDFRLGKIDVLINMSILTEGFDCPALETVFCRPSGKGCTIQMAGRVLRKHDDFPNKNIIQCKQTRHPFPRTATPNEQYVWMDDQWRSLTMNQHLHALSHRTLKLIAGTKVDLPKRVKENRVRKGPWAENAS